MNLDNQWKTHRKQKKEVSVVPDMRPPTAAEIQMRALLMVENCDDLHDEASSESERKINRLSTEIAATEIAIENYDESVDLTDAKNWLNSLYQRKENLENHGREFVEGSEQIRYEPNPEHSNHHDTI